MTRPAIASLILAVLALALAVLALCGGAAPAPDCARRRDECRVACRARWGVGELDTACAASECLTCYRACPRCKVRR